MAGTALTGEISVDGSSTVYPISEAVAEEFAKVNPDVTIGVAKAGTGGGMKRFGAGEIDICDASREIKPEEDAACKEKGIEHVRFTIATDGIAIVANPENTWCDSLTVEQLKKLWTPDNPAKTWADLDPSWPSEEIELYGPGTDSGTFEYFTEEIVGEKNSSRGDYSPSEDDNVLVTGIAGNKNALGYFGFGYYVENQDKLKLIAVDSGKGPVKPSVESVTDNSYSPLSRPLFIYVKKESLKRPEVAAFVEFYISGVAELCQEVGCIPAPEASVAENKAALEAAK